MIGIQLRIVTNISYIINFPKMSAGSGQCVIVLMESPRLIPLRRRKNSFTVRSELLLWRENKLFLFSVICHSIFQKMFVTLCEIID